MKQGLIDIETIASINQLVDRADSIKASNDAMSRMVQDMNAGMKMKSMKMKGVGVQNHITRIHGDDQKEQDCGNDGILGDSSYDDDDDDDDADDDDDDDDYDDDDGEYDSEEEEEDGRGKHGNFKLSAEHSSPLDPFALDLDGYAPGMSLCVYI